jgi:hypothetical protein
MGRFPVTLYKEQWLKLLDKSADIREFIAANETELAVLTTFRRSGMSLAAVARQA